MKTLIGLAIALPLCAANYDTATVIDFTAKVTAVREAPQSDPMPGVHLTVQVESQTVDIYVGPAEFVKIFDVKFTKGDQVHVIGSKVEDVVLAREVTIGNVTLLCRDKDGAPLWKYFLKPPVG